MAKAWSCHNKISQIGNRTSVLVKTQSERHAILCFTVCSLAKVCRVNLSFAVIKIKVKNYSSNKQTPWQEGKGSELNTFTRCVQGGVCSLSSVSRSPTEGQHDAGKSLTEFMCGVRRQLRRLMETFNLRRTIEQLWQKICQLLLEVCCKHKQSDITKSWQGEKSSSTRFINLE